MSEQDTEDFIRSKIKLIEHYWEAPENEIPECTDEELWKSEPQYKYFADPAKALVPGARSSKNFDNITEAMQHKAAKGVGTIITIPGAPKRCDFCDSFPLCTQKDKYL